jgi:hypothetical protein
MVTRIPVVGCANEILVDSDVAELLGHLPWRLTAGRIVAVIDNEFLDFSRLVAGHGCVRISEDPSDYRRANFRKLTVRGGAAGAPHLQLDLVDIGCSPPISRMSPPPATAVLRDTSWTFDGRRRFCSFQESRQIANVSVDSIENEGTVLTLSHWPSTATPTRWKDDLSTNSVFKYLAASGGDLPAEVVTSDHFDVDGAISIYACLRPEWAFEHRDLLSDIATCGDFCVVDDPLAARVAFSLNYLAVHPNSPVGAGLERCTAAERHARLYSRILPQLAELIEHPDRHAPFWQAEECLFLATEEIFRRQQAIIEDMAGLDMAVVKLDVNVDESVNNKAQPTTMRYLGFSSLPFHARTARSTILVAQGRRYEVRQRYESWVELISESKRPRRDLSPLAEALNRIDNKTPGNWIYSGVEQFMPLLSRCGSGESSLDPQRFISLVEEFLRIAPPAWSPQS